MSYRVTIDANSWREPNKDEVIARLMSYINGDGGVDFYPSDLEWANSGSCYQ